MNLLFIFKKSAWLFIIFVLAFALRFYRINVNTPPLYVDEVSSKYLALPWYLSSPNLTDAFFNILYSPFNLVWLFGFNPLGVRLPSVIFGSISAFFIYLFVKEIPLNLSRNRSTLVAIVTFGLVAILPWHFMISRLGFSAISILLILQSLHFYFYFKAKSTKGYLISILFLLLGIFCYPSLIIIAPFIIAWIIFLILKKFKISKVAAIGIILISAILISGFFFLRYGGFASHNRGLDLVIWNDVNTTSDFNFYRGYARLSEPSVFSLTIPPEDLLSKIYFNKYTSVFHVFIKNYLSFFSGDFLFLKGDPILRHSTGTTGTFYPILFPFMIYGAYYFFKNSNKKLSVFILLWVILSPVPAAISKDGSQYLLRVLTVMPILSYFAGLGLVNSLNFFSQFKKLYVFFISLTLFLSAFYFFFNYYHVYPFFGGRSYEYGFKEVSDFQLENNLSPLLVIWDGYYPHYYFRFWQAERINKYKLSPISEVVINNDKYFIAGDNLYFSYPKSENDLYQIMNAVSVSYVAIPIDYLNKNSEFKLFKQKPLKVINYPSQDPAFYIFKNEI